MPMAYTVLPLDILALVLEQLEDDKPSQRNVSLTCRAWLPPAQRALLQHVDISSHNLGRRPQFECNVQPLVLADYHAQFRQRNLVPRQRSFLRYLFARPELARHVKKFTWTLVWLDYDEEQLTEVDRLTWSVFQSLVNVARLDLASLHEVSIDTFVRQNPAELFPAVTDLRLGGWMHRGLVRAVLTSLDVGKLRSLKLDYMQDEGAFPGGAPINDEFAMNNARHAEATENSDVFDEVLLERQESGEAIIFPGPMWYALLVLCRGGPLNSLTYLQIKLLCFERTIDLRNYYTMFATLANLLVKARLSLKSILIAGDEQCAAVDEIGGRGCGTTWRRFRGTVRPWLALMAARFMTAQLSVLNQSEFPHLRRLRFEGFRILKTEIQRQSLTGYPELEAALEAIRYSRVEDAAFMEEPSIDAREVFYGYECWYDETEDLQTYLARS